MTNELSKIVKNSGKGIYNAGEHIVETLFNPYFCPTFERRMDGRNASEVERFFKEYIGLGLFGAQLLVESFLALGNNWSPLLGHGGLFVTTNYLSHLYESYRKNKEIPQ